MEFIHHVEYKSVNSHSTALAVAYLVNILIMYCHSTTLVL